MIDTKKQTKAQLAGCVEALQCDNRALSNRLTLEKASYERNMTDLKKHLELDKIRMQGQLVQAASQMIEALARMIGGPGF